jgi:hypothetical protein
LAEELHDTAKNAARVKYSKFFMTQVLMDWLIKFRKIVLVSDLIEIH